jgi:hypothetical protein
MGKYRPLEMALTANLSLIRAETCKKSYFPEKD